MSYKLEQGHSHENKERVVAYLRPELIAQCKALQTQAEAKNMSEFVAIAVDFYVGYLKTKNTSCFLSRTITSYVERFLGDKLRYLQTNLYRLAVEIDMMMHLIAASMEIDDETLQQLRKRSTAEVQSMRGNVQIEKAMRFQHSDSEYAEERGLD